MCEDESTLEEDGSTDAIVLDWTREEFCECSTLSTGMLALLLTVVKVLFSLTVANDLSNTEGEEMLLVAVSLAATDKRSPLVVGDGIGDNVVVFITKTSEASVVFVCLDGLDAVCLSLEVSEMAIVGVLDETVVWAMLPLFDGKTNSSEDRTVTVVLLLEMTWEAALTVPAELMP